MSKGLSRTSLSSTNLSAPTAPSRATRLPTTTSATAISALPGRNSGSAKKSTECRALSSMRKHDALSRQQAGLRGLFLETAVLSEGTRPQDPALHPRERSRHGARHRQDRGVQDLALSAQKGRDAVRPPQTHPEARDANADLSNLRRR